MQIRKGGSWRTITSATAYINGAWRQVLFGQAYKTGQWRNVCNFTITPTPTPTPTPTMTLTVNTSSDNATAQNSSITSDPITATPSGGKSPYTYDWSFVSKDGNRFTIDSPTSATTTVTVTNLASSQSAHCSINCVAKDSTGLSATSATTSITFTNNSTGGSVAP